MLTKFIDMIGFLVYHLIKKKKGKKQMSRYSQ